MHITIDKTRLQYWLEGTPAQWLRAIESDNSKELPVVQTDYGVVTQGGESSLIIQLSSGQNRRTKILVAIIGPDYTIQTCVTDASDMELVAAIEAAFTTVCMNMRYSTAAYSCTVIN